MTSTGVPVKRALVELLREWGTEYIFGNPGSTEVPLLDTLVDFATPSYILTLHEAVAIAMADAYAQLTGRAGIVSVHATPGTANIVGGLFLAKAHRSPVVVLAGQQDSRILDRRPFLASDLAALVGQYTKAATQVTRSEDVVETVHDAMLTAIERPRGPVLVAIPRDLHDGITDPPGSKREEPPPRTPDPTDIADAAALLISAKTPVLLSGNGVGARGQQAVDAAVNLAELIGARVFSEHNAINMHFPSSHPQYLGGNAHGTAGVRAWLEDADVIVALGCDLFMEDRYHEVPLISPEVKVVQLDEDPAEVGRVFPVAAGVTGDIVHGITALTAAVRRLVDEDYRVERTRRLRQISLLRKAADDQRRTLANVFHARKPIRMTRVYHELRRVMRDEDIMVDEAVNMASYLHDFFDFRRAGTLLSSKQGWLGWGWGAALGAQLARPDARVVACLGDGSAAYTLQALWTARKYRIPITAVILANGRYMAVENHLRNYRGRAITTRRYVGTELDHVGFTRIASGFGVMAEAVADPDGLEPALRRGLESGEPALIEVVIDPDDAGLGRDPIPR